MPDVLWKGVWCQYIWIDGAVIGSGCVHGWICMYVVAIYLFLNALNMYRDEGSNFVCAIM